MEKREYRYEIGGNVYVQRMLVLGQVRQLTGLLQELRIEPEKLDAAGLLTLLGERLPEALAIVLTEEGKSPRDKDLKALAEEIEFSIEAETVVQVIEDFFSCNPAASLFDRLAGVVQKVNLQAATGSKTPASSSHEATSRNEMRSSGDAHSMNAGPGSSTQAGK